MPINQPFAEFFGKAYVTLTNARTMPAILDQLRPYGFDETRLDQGLSLYHHAHNLYREQKQKYGTQLGLTQDLNTQWKQRRETYSIHRALARDIFRHNRSLYHTLRLDEQRQNTFFLWVAQATSFYENLLATPDALTTFADIYNQTPADFTAASHAIQDLEDLKARQQSAKGEAQQATQDRNIAIKELQTFLRRLTLVAKRALPADQALEALHLGPIP